LDFIPTARRYCF